MDYLPSKTLKDGISFIKYPREKGKEVKMVFIVNDWQWLEGIEGGEENTYRDNYYKKLELPKSYKKEFMKNGINENIIIPFKNKQGKILNKFFFSEKKLRNQFSRHFASTCPVGYGCAQEYVPMLFKIEKENIKLFIGFIPKTCQMAVSEGAKKFKQTYKSNMKIVNVFVNGIFNKDFYENIELEIL